jgi:hypothetical protein
MVKVADRPSRYCFALTVQCEDRIERVEQALPAQATRLPLQFLPWRVRARVVCESDARTCA